jgi:hypothetical protein
MVLWKTINWDIYSWNRSIIKKFTHCVPLRSRHRGTQWVLSFLPPVVAPICPTSCGCRAMEARWILVLVGGSLFDVFIGLFRACVLLRKVWWWRLSRDGMTVLLAHRWRSCGGLAWTDLIAFGMCSMWPTLPFIDTGCCSHAPVLSALARRLFICPLQQDLIQQALPLSNEGGARTATRVWLVVPVLVVIAKWSSDLFVILLLLKFLIVLLRIMNRSVNLS